MARPESDPDEARRAAAVACSALCAEVPRARCVRPAALHRRLRRHGGALFARTAADVQVLSRAPLRLTVHGDRVAVVAREPQARPLLAALAERLDGARVDGDELLAPVPQPPASEGRLDRDVLRERSVFDPLRALLALVADRDQAPVPVTLCGAFAFDLVDRFDALGARRPDPFDDPDIDVLLGLDLVRYGDDVVTVVTRGLPWEAMADVVQRHQRTLSALAAGDEAVVAGSCGPRRAERPDAEFVDGVERLREHIAAGDVFQAVLSRAVRWQGDVDALEAFERLAAREPAPYQFHLELQRGALFGSSPETCVRVQQGEVEIRPIAGTTLRDADADTDERLALALLFDRKERAEHVMLLDLARNDVARVAEPGSTAVVQQFAIEKYSRVQHLVSRVRGTLRADLDALHAYRAAANMGTLSGAPKPRAMELIRAIEPVGRGYYGGAVVAMTAGGDLDSCIVIRSVRARDGVFRAQAGAGVVWHSDARRELEETERKLRAVSEVMASFAAAATEVQA
ncbi:MAG: anthranilate synthase component I family protein [Planctomycetota bacterium]